MDPIEELLKSISEEEMGDRGQAYQKPKVSKLAPGLAQSYAYAAAPKGPDSSPLSSKLKTERDTRKP